MTDDDHNILDFDAFAGDFGAPGDRVLKNKMGIARKAGECQDVLPPAPTAELEPVFTPQMIEAIYAAWHGAGVDLAGGNWVRFVGMLPRA